MAVKPTDTLSSDYSGVDSLFDSLESPAEAPAEEEDQSHSDPDPEQPEEDTEVSEVQEDEDDEESDIWEIAANGQKHKIDPKNVDEVKRLLSFGLGAKQAFSNLAKARQEVKRLTQEMKTASTAKEKAQLFDKLEEVKDDENELFRLITGGKSLDDVVKAKMDKLRELESLDPVERKEYEAQERERALQARIEKMEAAVRKEKEEALRAAADADDKKTYSTVYPEFQKIFKDLNIKDPTEAQETAADLWSLGWDRIGRLAKQAEDEGREIELTPDFVRRQFQVIAKRWGYSVKEATKKEVTKVLDKKSKDATKRAGLAATRNVSKPSSKLDGLSPTKKFERLFGR